MARHSIVSPLGSLLDELREERARDPAPPRRARAREIAPRPPRREGTPEPELLLESGVVSGGRARPARSWRWAPALALHAAGLVAVIVIPVLLAEELPSPAAGVGKVFFAPTVMAPPLPPPPPARRAAEPAPRKDVAPARTSSIAAPVEAARQWVFAPTLFRGVPVSVMMTVSVRFSLTQGMSASAS